jgi:hypothetical protein
MECNQVKEKWRLGMTIPMKVVRPGFPQVQQQEDSLRSDLRRMGCESFLEVPWDITDENIVAEIATHRPVAEFKGLGFRNPLHYFPSQGITLHLQLSLYPQL